MGEVFPAYVGMSPKETKCQASILSVPRIRGDEPSKKHYGKSATLCSPHTWG